MIKKEITYEDYNGDTCTEEFYFNLSKNELLKEDAMVNGGLQHYLESIYKSKDYKEMYMAFDKIIRMSVGVKSEDGKRFIKNPDIVNAFVQSPAYDELILEIGSDDVKAFEFIKGMLPKDLQKDIDEANKEMLNSNADNNSAKGDE